MNERFDFVKKVTIVRRLHVSRSVGNLKIKRESESFHLNPYFVIDRTGVEIRISCVGKHYVATSIAQVLTETKAQFS